MDSSSSGGRSGRSNQSRSRGNRNQDRGSRQGGAERFPRPEPSPTIGQKILGFLGIGKKEEAPVEKPASRPPSGGGSGSDRSTGAQARKRVRKTQGPSSSERVPVSGTRLHVGNLNYDSTGEDLSGLFQEAGTVVSAEIVTNPHSGRSKGFAFVEMSSVDEARAVADKFHGQDFMGRDLVISGAKSKGPREGDRDRVENRDRRSSRGDGSSSRSSSEDRPPRQRKSRAEREQRTRGGSPPPEGVERFDQAPKKVNVEQVSGARLTIDNLDPEILKGDLIGLIGGLGTIVAHEITGGSATVELGSVDEAQRTVEVLNGKQFMGRQLKVSGATGDAPLEGASASASEPEPDAEAPAEETPAEETASDSSEPEPAAESESPAEEASEPEPAAEEATSEPASPEPEPSFEEAVTEPITPESESASEEPSAPEAENAADEGSEEKPAAE